MRIWTRRFNTYFAPLLLVLVLAAGCKTDQDKDTGKEKKKKDKEATTLGVHLEVNPSGTGRDGPVTVLRENSITLNVLNAPFLTHGDVLRADVIEEMGVQGIRLWLSQPTGARTLEYVTASHKGKHMAIHAEFGEARWIAAPLITRMISDGVLTFTADVNREEADRIVRGLNNVAKAVNKK